MGTKIADYLTKQVIINKEVVSYGTIYPYSHPLSGKYLGHIPLAQPTLQYTRQHREKVCVICLFLRTFGI